MQDTHDLAAMVARHLDGWTYTPPADKNEMWPVLDGPDGQQIGIRNDYPAKHRLALKGRYLSEDNGQPAYPSEREKGEHKDRITVSAEKTPEKIAQDIKRRLLPGYTVLFKLIAQQVKESNDQRATAKRNINEIADIFNAEVRGGNRDYSVVDLPHELNDRMYGHFKHEYARYRIELRAVPHELAVKIAKLLKDEK